MPSRKKVQLGNGQEMAQSERNSYSTNRRVGKNKNDTLVLIPRKHKTYRKPCG